MKLAKALRRLLLLANDDDLVALFPGNDGGQGVVAFQGQGLGMAVDVDAADLPPRMLVANELRSILAPAPPSATVEIVAAQGYGQLRVSAGLVARDLASRPLSDAPTLPRPEAGAWHLTRDWAAVRLLRPFCAPAWMGGLSAIKFSRGLVEATDTAVYAQARVDVGIEGLVPGHFFDHWPVSADVRTCVHGGRVFVEVGEERRWTTLLPSAKFPDRDLVPGVHSGPMATVDCPRFVAAVEQVKKLGLVEGVRVQTGTGVLRLSAGGSGSPAVVELPAQTHDQEPAETWVSSRLLARMVKGLKTPRLGVGLGPKSTPLRLESGPMVLCLWPLLRPGEALA